MRRGRTDLWRSRNLSPPRPNDVLNHPSPALPPHLSLAFPPNKTSTIQYTCTHPACLLPVPTTTPQYPLQPGLKTLTTYVGKLALLQKGFLRSATGRGEISVLKESYSLWLVGGMVANWEYYASAILILFGYSPWGLSENRDSIVGFPVELQILGAESRYLSAPSTISPTPFHQHFGAYLRVEL